MTQPLASFPVHVFYEDTDAGGVVYHANYLRYFERARSLWLKSLGLTHTHLAKTLDIGFVVTGAHVKFRLPARLDDELAVTVETINKRRASVIFNQHIYHDEQCLIKGQFTVATVKLSNFKPCGLPEILRNF